MALSLVEQVASIAQAAPFIAPAAALLSQILEGYRSVKDLDDKRDGLCTFISDLTGDICAAVLRMEETHHSDLVGRLKPDLETYAALIGKASAFIAEFDKHGFFFRAVSRSQMDSKLTALNEELNSFGARFRSNRLVDIAINQNASDRILGEVHDIVAEKRHQEWLLNPPDMKVKQAELQKLRKEGTGHWFLGSGKFIEWQDNPGSLWLRGPSGAGKSVLSSTVIRKLVADKELFQDSHPPGVAFFYFQLTNPDGQSVENALRRIILQLSAQAPHPFRTLENKYKSSNGQTVPTYQDLVLILQQLFREIGRTYIILDALDECSPGDFDQLLELISTLRKWTETPLHLMITSQPRQALIEDIEGMPLVTLEADVVHADIMFFLTSEIGTKSNLKIWRPQTEHIVERITEKSQGMFRLAACLLIQLSRCQWEDELDKTLDDLPGDLFGIYDRFLEAIRPTDMVYVKAVLRWLLFSKRDIYLNKLADAVAFDFSNSKRYNCKPNRRGGNERAILNWLDGLIVVNMSSRLQWVTLAHASVHDFLLSQHFADKFNTDLSDRGLSHSFITQSCIDYLLYLGDEVQISNLGGRRGGTVFEPYLLAKYASKYWCYHLMHSKDRTELHSSSMHLLDHKRPPYKVLAQLLRVKPLLQLDESSPESPLALCCQEGYIEGVRFLLENDPSGIPDPQALEISSREGHTEIVRLLFQNGAGIKPGNMETALVVAIQRDHTEIVHLLLENGVDVDEALIIAAERGREDVASLHAHQNVIRFLLDKGANINGRPGAGSTPLIAAVLAEEADIINLLLENGADVNLRTEAYGTALEIASWHSFLEDIRLLIQNGADPNLSSPQHRTALEWAAVRGYTDLVQVLLDNGADVNLRRRPDDIEGALVLASRYGRTDMIRLLIEKGIDLEAQGTLALQAAEDNEQSEALDILREHGCT